MSTDDDELEIPRAKAQRVKAEKAETPAADDKPYMTVKLFQRKHLNGDAFWNPNGDALAAPQDVEPGVAVTLKRHRAQELIAKGAAVAV